MSSEKQAQIGDWGFDLRGFNTKVRPQDDFDKFVNSTWRAKTTIPAKETSWGSFNILSENSRQAINEILKEISLDADAVLGSNRQKLRDFYKLSMNSRKLNREGAGPLAEEFEIIDSIYSRGDLARVIARLHSCGINVFWQTNIHPDPANSKKMVLAIDQGGFSLPERGYYFDEDKKDKRVKFTKHVQRIFELLGYNKKSAKLASEVVVVLETKLAKKAWNPVQLRDIASQLNYLKVPGVSKLTPVIDWDFYFNELGVEKLETLLVGQLKFMQRVNSLLSKTTLDNLKLYMKYWLVKNTANFLSNDFVDEDFDFWGKILNGQKELKPRWERTSALLNSLLGEALGQAYVERHFTPETKEEINKLVDNLISVTKHRINSLDWMSPQTKRKAMGKVNAFVTKLGYPDEWIDYSELEVKKDSLVQNYLRTKLFHSKRKIAKLGKPTDRSEWHMSPPTVNAYYNPLSNEIVFPAGILQAPFFDPNADDAVNYGAIGAVIGHEISHGFDDQGSQFDKDGNFKNWWTDKDRKEFEKRCHGIVEQFNTFEVFEDLFVNGELTQGENIGDFAGLSIAYEAYMNSLNDKNKSLVIDGFTPEQRFFLGFAQAWRIKQREEYARVGIAIDPHSPPRFRILGTLKNMPEFFEAFNVKEGDEMYRSPEERVKIW